MSAWRGPVITAKPSMFPKQISGTSERESRCRVSIENGDMPAMPVECYFAGSGLELKPVGLQTTQHSAWATGLTKRELFAAMAMQGLLACPAADGDANKFASAAVLYADGLLRELAKKVGAS